MRTLIPALAVLLAFLISPLAAHAEDGVLFEDDFEKGLSDKWEIVGLEKEDYRIRDGGLEMRVQAGETGMFKVMLPFTSYESVTVSVRVTPLDDFTEEKELAGVFLLDEGGREFAAKKQHIDGKLVFAPGKYVFHGKPDERGDVEKYTIKYTAAKPEAGPLRIIVDRGNAFFQVGPKDGTEEFLNFFHSALRRDAKERGFCLSAAGAPKDKAHWVRFDDFRVEKH